MDVPRILSIVKMQCDRPDPHRPGDDHYMMALRKCSQELHNRLGVALPAWDILSADVIPNGSTAINLNVASFSKPRRCYAMMSSTEGYDLNCPVKIVDVDELNLYQGNALIAEAVAPFYKDGQWKVQFAPYVTGGYTCRIWYETGELPWYGRSDKPLPQIEQYHYLLADLMTVELLPHCWWSRLLGKEVDMKASEQKKLMDSHAAGLMRRSESAIARQFPVFQEAISSLLASQEPSVNAYGDHFGEFDDHNYLN